MFYSSSQGRRMIACAFCSVRVNAATISSPTSPISSTTPSSPTSTLGPQKGSLHERREGRGHKKSSSSASDTLVNVALAHLNFPGFHRRHSAPLHAPSPLVSPILATKDRSKQGAVSYFDAGRRTSASGAYPAEERSGSQEAHVEGKRSSPQCRGRSATVNLSSTPPESFSSLRFPFGTSTLAPNSRNPPPALPAALVPWESVSNILVRMHAGADSSRAANKFLLGLRARSSWGRRGRGIPGRWPRRWRQLLRLPPSALIRILPRR